METENKIIFVMALLMAIGSGVGMFYNYSLVLFFACGLSLLYAIKKDYGVFCRRPLLVLLEDWRFEMNTYNY